MKVQYAKCANILLFCILTLQMIGQNPVSFQAKGLLADSLTKKPVEFATIAVSDQNKKVLALTYSDENGNFKVGDLTEGSFLLTFSFVGYSVKTISLSVSGRKPVTDLGAIYIRPEVTELQTVTITGTKPLVEQQPGMLIYNADRDISNSGGSAADVLRKAPILNVDAAGNVSMRGNRNLRILINGKYSGQMARSAADALNMMPANVIQTIEIITSPSARYDAEGAAGVINIITKKGYQSLSGTVEVVAGNMEQAVNPRISINRGKWNIVSYLHLHQFRSREETTLNRITYENGNPTGSIYQQIIEDNRKPHGSGDMQIEFAPDSSQLFNFSFNGWFGKWPNSNTQQFTRYNAAGQVVDAFNQDVTSKSPTLGADLNLGYTRKFKKPGEELYLMAQHSNYTEGFNYTANRNNPEGVFTYRELNDNRYHNGEWTLQADYVLPFGKNYAHALESGTKMIWRNNSSNYNVQASADGDPDNVSIVPSRTDIFDYTQNVFAGYGQLKLKGKNGWALHFGLRLEGTFLEGVQQNQQIRFQNNFWNLIPSATLFKRINTNNNLTLSYTKRISRPSIWELNPNRNEQDPQNITVGNPDLRPEELHQVEFSYALQTENNFFLNASLFGRGTNNSIENIIEVNSAGAAISSKQNVASNARYGINLSTALNITPAWKLNSNANFGLVNFKSTALNIDNQGKAWGINLNSSWKLPARITLQAYGDYDARSTTLQGFEGAWFYYSFSAKKEFPAKKLNLTLTTVSPFGSYLDRKTVTGGSQFWTQQTNAYLMRTIRLSLNWEFGGSFKSGQSRKINNDDLKTQKKSG